MERKNCQGLLVRLKGEKRSRASVQFVWGTGGSVENVKAPKVLKHLNFLFNGRRVKMDDLDPELTPDWVCIK
jgi:hypothetical protein